MRAILYPTLPFGSVFLGLLICLSARAAFTPEAFYVDYAYNVPTDIITSHSRVIVHPQAQVDLVAAKSAGTTVYGYISVGELGADAPHRAAALQLGLPLRGKNPIWNSDLLDLRDGRWATFLVETVARAAAEKGLSGFFLDTLDSIEIAGTAAEIEEQRVGLVALIKKLKATYPQLPIIVNRGFSTLPQLVGVAQGLLVESVYSAYDFGAKRYVPTNPSDTAELVSTMENAISLGFEVYVLDYADPADPEAALAAAKQILEAGYHAFVSTPDLNGIVLGPWEPVPPALVAPLLGLVARSGQEIGLRVLAVADPVPSYTWYHDGDALMSDTANRLILANVQAADAGEYRVVISNRFGSVSSASVRLTVDDLAIPGRILNLSSRARSEGVVAPVTPGVVSTGPVEVLARAVGPTLANFQVPDVLANPDLTVIGSDGTRRINQDWEDEGSGVSLAAAAVTVGAFPLNTGSKDAALRFTLNGAATLPIDGNGESGETLVEIYELLPASAQWGLSNISTRAKLGQGGQQLVLGFVLGGESASQLLIRAVGPGLADFGVVDVMSNPQIKVYRNSELLAENKNWGTPAASGLRAASKADQVGAFAMIPDSADAALVLTLPPGSYTAVISGEAGSTGVVLAEVYLVP